MDEKLSADILAAVDVEVSSTSGDEALSVDKATDAENPIAVVAAGVDSDSDVILAD